MPGLNEWRKGLWHFQFHFLAHMAGLRYNESIPTKIQLKGRILWQ